jgi:GNAT superfamily N-acetyltransferase
VTTTTRARVATIDDASDLARLNALFNGVNDTAEELAARLADSHCVETPIVAEAGGRIVGFAALRLAPCVFYAASHAELTELFVEEAYRRRGIGRVLIAHAERLARMSGAAELILLTGPANHEAQAFYRSLGYRDHELSMAKTL